VIKSSAQAWIWIPEAEQAEFAHDIQRYGTSRSLRFDRYDIPAPWKMISLQLTTPKGNKIEVVNATGRDKFLASITVFHQNEDWMHYWQDFRSHFSVKHKWQDVP
jgi:hypothetical protein